MAKGNLILGTAQKKLGDVVMYRRNGVQQARVRVRTIQNPKTEGQALQRNFMAPVAKFYAPLAGVLERSWEGLNKSQSHNAFTKANVELARANGWYVEKGAGFTPLPYKVSKGVMDPMVYAMDSAAGTMKWYISSLAAGADALKIATISAALVALGYKYGDQVTFIFFIGSEDSDDVRPAWLRFILSESDQTELTTLLPNGVDTQVTAGVVTFSGDVDVPLIGGAIIASRWDGRKWLRSTQYVVVDEDYLALFTSQEARAAAIASYRGGASVVQSDVYLNGGSGSTDAGAWDGLVYIYNSESGNRVGIAKVEGVMQGLGSSAHAQIWITNQSSGITSLANVKLGGTTADAAHLLLNSGSFAEGTPEVGALIDYTESGNKFKSWLAANGITVA